ncbi:MAG: chemotaxis protein CheR [Blastocatellia bacterium]|nr:MAG: chemotaxis protein CheR [Blastocatellia bacterium]
MADPSTSVTAEDREFENLLEHLRRTRGFDFNAYKRASLMRRVRKRLQGLNLERFGDYTDYLEVHPEEFAHLFNVLLINVTSFFRDDPPWLTLRDDVLPGLISARPNDPVRVWSAGCASGEEVYSIAMLLAEILGRDQFRERVKIYATDMDNEALAQARAAAYTEKQVQTVPQPFRDAYFSREDGRLVFDKDLRRSVIFGRHDLIQDAPISRVNLLICRNTLMYFNSEAQSRILARFHFALRDDGVLFLGKAEMLLTHPQLFMPLDLRRRIFRKLSKDGWRDRMAIMTQANGDELFQTANVAEVFPLTLDANPHAQFVVDASGNLALANERARTLFRIAPSDIGRPIQDLDLSYRPNELRAMIEQARLERRPIALQDAENDKYVSDGRHFDVYATPMFDSGGRLLGVSLTFTDVSRQRDLHFQLNRARQDLETAYEELQSTNEELETTNEELQSTVEELETTNEELQSTNEELETMNEELQSTNEELQTINDELRQRSDDLNRSNAFLESVLTGVRSGVVVLNRELHVIAWNHRAEDLWGLRADEVRNQNFLNLDIGLPIDQLRSSIRTCLSGDNQVAEVIVQATNRRGKPINCKVIGTPLQGSDHDVRGVILMMDEQPLTAVEVH